MRLGMVTDLKRCIGCESCVIACKAENATPPDIFWAKVMEREEGKYPTVHKIFLPVRCNHCLKAPCVEVCPTGASSHRAEDNLVLIDQEKCIGCQSCMIACPYEARYLWENGHGYYGDSLTPYEVQGYQKHRAGTVQKCDFCSDRISNGLDPACVQTCPTKALAFGDLDDSNSEVSLLRRQRTDFQLRSDLGTDPSIYYLG